VLKICAAHVATAVVVIVVIAVVVVVLTAHKNQLAIVSPPSSQSPAPSIPFPTINVKLLKICLQRCINN